VVLGGEVQLRACLRSTAKVKQTLVVDFVVHHQKANASTTPRVFKWKGAELAPCARLALEKRHSLRPISTRKYYRGAHQVDLLVNGVVLAKKAFTLEVP
jgi:hypothetical protein